MAESTLTIADTLPSPWAATSRVRLRTLILLRWLAIFGQTVAILFARYGLEVDFPFTVALTAIGASVALNMVLIAARPVQHLAREWEAAAQLGYDVVQLAVLLALTGGLQNPFVFLFVAPVAVSATVLRPAITAVLAALTFLCVGAISVWRLPLPWPSEPGFEPPQLYEMGVAAAVLVGLGFTSVYAWRVAAEEERLNVALAAVQAVLAREQKLSALGSLAAAAAHELGTPLATIHLVAKELARDLPEDDPRGEDMRLIASQSERCRAILAQLAARREESDAMHARARIEALIAEIVEPHRGLGAEIRVKFHGEGAIEVRRLPEIVHALGAFVENAVGFAAAEVEIAARWDSEHVEITVNDDGPGFAPGVLGRLGEPYLTEREAGAAGGLGLGFFIAKTLIERTGARLEAGNRPAPRQGAFVCARWPRGDIEAPPL